MARALAFGPILWPCLQNVILPLGENGIPVIQLDADLRCWGSWDQRTRMMTKPCGVQCSICIRLLSASRRFVLPCLLKPLNPGAFPCHESQDTMPSINELSLCPTWHKIARNIPKPWISQPAFIAAKPQASFISALQSDVIHAKV